MGFKDLLGKGAAHLTKVGFELKKHGPDIGTVGGVIGVAAGMVLVGIASTKVKDILEEHNAQMHEVHERSDAIKDLPEEKRQPAEKDIKRETTHVYFHTGREMFRLYAPAVAVTAVSLTAILVSHNVLKKRNMGLAAAYAAVDQGFRQYRSRVVERFGEEVDRQILHGSTMEEVSEKVEDENGKKRTVKSKVEVVDPNTESMYMKYFTKTNPNWDRDVDFLLNYFFPAQQRYATDKLKAVGHLTLNEAYEMLGFQHNKAGMVCGWIYDLKNPNGDNRVIFDVREVYLRNEDGILEKAFAIDFNVDGNIYDRML